MGCDIHIVVERRQPNRENKWVGILSTDASWLVSKNIPASDRDYEFFAQVAGVRGHPKREPRFHEMGLPEDISDLAKSEFYTDQLDNHSSSHLGIKDFCDAWYVVNKNQYERVTGKTIEPTTDDLSYYLFGIYNDYNDVNSQNYSEFRVVFWFDN